MFRFFNPNPNGKRNGDCVVRAISKATGQDWDAAFAELSSIAFAVKDMPSSNYVWGELLKRRGFKKSISPNDCPYCYTVGDFAKDHPRGTYILGTGTHVVAIVDGDIYDTWDSSDEIPSYYFERG